MVKRLTFLDKAFWLTESDDNPKHVACLQLLELPQNAPDDYVIQLVEQMRSFDQPKAPFSCVVKTLLGFPLGLQNIERLDMSYHVQLHDVQGITNMEKLHKYTAKLHEPRLDQDKPLWQFHVIQDKSAKQYAIYVKIHHIYGDGATLVRWFEGGYQSQPDQDNFVPIWAMERPKRKSKKVKPSFIRRLFNSFAGFFIATFHMGLIFVRLFFKAIWINRHYMPIPFSGTKTVLTGQVKKGRVVTTCDLEFDRIKSLSRRLRVTVNEVLLCSFDMGVRRFLRDHNQSFDKALYTNMPINLRKAGEEVGGNKIAIVPVRLAFGPKDPYLRLRQIAENHRVVKNAAKKSHPGTFAYYTVLIQSFALMFELLKVSDFIKPIANILISNVPGPKDARYLKDSKLKALYPISTITPGGGVNITLITYQNKANIGLVASNHKIKSLEKMALYFVEAFELLELSVERLDLDCEHIGRWADYVDKTYIQDGQTVGGCNKQVDNATFSKKVS